MAQISQIENNTEEIYQNLVKHLRPIVVEERESKAVLLNAKHRIGVHIRDARLVLDMNLEGPKLSKAQMMERLSKDLDYSISELYRCLSFAEKYYTWEEFRSKFEELARKNSPNGEISPNWEFVRREMLPTSNNKSETKRISITLPAHNAKELIKETRLLGVSLSFVMQRLLTHYQDPDSHFREPIAEDIFKISQLDRERAEEENARIVLKEHGEKEEKKDYKDSPEDFVEQKREEIQRGETEPIDLEPLKNKHYRSSRLPLPRPILVWKIPSLENYGIEAMLAIHKLSEERSRIPEEIIEQRVLEWLNNKRNIELLFLDGNSSTSLQLSTPKPVNPMNQINEVMNKDRMTGTQLTS